MPKAPPSFDFFPNDWLGGTRTLSSAARGAYIDLLCHQWVNGFIPETPKERRALCGVSDANEWESIWNEIRLKFSCVEYCDLVDSDQAQPNRHVLANQKLCEQREKYLPKWKKMRVQNRQNARMRWNKPRKQAKNKRCDSHADRIAVLEDGRGKVEGTSKRKKESAPEWHSSIPAGRLRDSVEIWLAYKSERREKYVPSGLAKFITRLVKLTEEHGEPAVIESIDQAIASNWAGWEHGLRESSKPLRRRRRLQIPVTDGSDR